MGALVGTKPHLQVSWKVGKFLVLSVSRGGLHSNKAVLRQNGNTICITECVFSKISAHIFQIQTDNISNIEETEIG